MKLGTDTGFYGKLSLGEALERLAGLGWKGVQVAYGHIKSVIEGHEDWEERLREIGGKCDKLGITVWQVHCNKALGPGGEHVAANVKWLDYTKALGADCLITHANGDADYNTEEERQRCLGLNLNCLKEVASYAKELGLRVALENRPERPRGTRSWATCKRFGARMKDFLELIDIPDSGHLGVCMDTSHTRVARLSFADEIELCGEKLFATHVSDSDGETQHKMPFTLDIDWNEVVSSLEKIGYERLFALDGGGDRDATPEELDGKLLAFEKLIRPLLAE